MLRLRAEFLHGVNGHHGFVAISAPTWWPVRARHGLGRPAPGARRRGLHGDLISASALRGGAERARDALPAVRGRDLGRGLDGPVLRLVGGDLHHRVGLYARLSGDAADSLIVKRFGSENQFTVGASICKFTTAGW